MHDFGKSKCPNTGGFIFALYECVFVCLCVCMDYM